MQYRPLIAILDSDCQTVCIVTGYNGCRHLSLVTSAEFVDHSIGAFTVGIIFVAQLRYADKRIVNIMKVHIKRNNLRLELTRYSRKMVDFIRVLLLLSDGFAQRTQSRKFRTQTTSAPFLLVYAALRPRVNAWLV